MLAHTRVRRAPGFTTSLSLSLFPARRCGKYGIPMYITETGIADSRDTKRAIMIDAYFKEVRMPMHACTGAFTGA